MPWAAAAAVVGSVITSNATKANNNANLDAAAQQQQANLAANRVDQTAPGGSSVWGIGANGQPTQTVTLDSTQQKLLDAKNNTALTNAGVMGNLATSAAPMLSQTAGQNPQTAWQNVIGSGSTNLMTHDWLGNVSPTGQAVAAAGSAQSNQASGTPGGQGVDPLAGYFGHAPSGATSDYGPGGGYGNGFGAAPPAGGGASASSSQSTVTAPDPYKVRDTFDTSGVTTKLPTSIDDTSRRRVEEALMSRLNPQLQQDEQNLRTRLLNSGIEVGTDAYNREFNLQNQKANDARMQAVLAGGQEEDRQTKLLQGLNDQQFQQALATGKFGQDADMAMAANATSRSNATTAAGASGAAASAANAGALERLKLQLAQQSNEFNVNTSMHAAEFNNNLRNQQLQEELLLRRTPIQEMTAMQNLANPTMPTFQSYYTNSAQAPVQQASNPIAGGQAGLNLFNSWNQATSGP